MKKLFVSLLAIAGMVACTNDEVVSVQQGNPIAFDTFVENTTRVGYDSSNLPEGFNVWAFIETENGNRSTILDAEDVTRQGDQYVYGNTQYWVPDNTYYFAALAPMDSQNVTNLVLATGDAAKKGLGTFDFNNDNGTEDLIYAVYKVKASETTSKVTFTFKHLLSKVKFSFTNTFDNANYSIEVRDIAMTVPMSGNVNLAADEVEWTLGTTSLGLDFDETGIIAKDGSANSAERLTIPAGEGQVYGVTFKVDLYVGNGTDKVLAKTYEKSSTISGIEFEAGKAYNFAANINAESLALNEVVFDASVDGWDNAATVQLIDTPAKLVDAINDPEVDHIILDGDIDLGDLFGASTLSTRAAATLPIVITESKVLDLNGHKITTPLVEGSTTNHTYAFENRGSLTIQDSKGNGQIIARGIFNYGTMTLKSGTINACDGNGGYGVRNYEGAEFVMDGGYIITSLEDDNKVDEGGYDATPLRVDVGATAIINGGTIDNICDFTPAIYNEGTTTVKGGTITSIHSTVANYGTMTIDGGSFTCNGLEGITAHALWAAAGTTSINGGIFDGKDNYNGFNVDASKGAIVNINGGKFLPVHSGSLYGEGTIIVKGGEFFDNPSARVAEGYEAIKENGVWNVHALPVAQIGETEYYTLEEAVAAAKAGDTITLLLNITLAEQLGLPAGIIFNGNGKQINGTIYAGGDLTFAGHTKVTAFSASYYNRNITIGEGACLEVTGGGRVSLAYGNTFNITGSIGNAKTADKANIQPSLIIPAGISITGGNDAAMNVTNAYVQIGSTTSKPGAADGKFTFNFNNSIAEFSKEFGFYEPTGGKTPEFEMNITNSVFTTAAKLCVAAANSKITVDNSVVTLGTYLRNSGVIELNNGSVMTGSTIQFGENGGNNGTINVDASSLTITAGGVGHAFDGKGTGSINATNGATVNVDYYKGMTINVDATSTFTGTDVDANKKIYYVSDEMALVPTNPNALGGAVVVSNAWDKTTGKGVITFDRDLTTIGEKAFQRVTNTTPSNWATSITLPNSVKTIGDYAFAQCYNLKNIVIPDGVTSIGQYAFQSCDAVTTVTIGSGVTTIDSSAFYNCYEIKEIICKSTTAPALADKWVFNGVDKAATVYVPTASVDTYKAADIWKDFTNIMGR